MTGRRIGQTMLICLMAIMSSSSSALGQERSISGRIKSLSNDQENNILPIKKAYTYVSEYKRLPVFNFGIGKRWNDVNGIKGAQPYSFGFGKRATSGNLYPGRMESNYLPYINYDNWANDDSSAHTRDHIKRGGRIRQYDFGLGKRSLQSQLVPSNMAESHENNEEHLNKKYFNDDLEQRLLYGLSNSLNNDQDDVQEDD